MQRTYAVYHVANHGAIGPDRGQTAPRTSAQLLTPILLPVQGVYRSDRDSGGAQRRMLQSSTVIEDVSQNRIGLVRGRGS